MRTLTAYGIGVVIVLAILNGIAWLVGSPRLHGLNVFSAGFVLGMLGTCISAYRNGYRKVAMFDIDCRNELPELLRRPSLTWPPGSAAARVVQSKKVKRPIRDNRAPRPTATGHIRLQDRQRWCRSRPRH